MDLNYSRRSVVLLCFMVMLYLTIALTCDPIAFKLINFFSIVMVGASIIFPLTYAFMDLIAELFGNDMAKIIIWFHVFCDFLFTYIIIGITHLPSPKFWEHQMAYNTVIDPMGRLYISNLVGMIASSLLNIFVLKKLKIFTKNKFFWARSFIAITSGIVAYTVITDVLAFTGAYSKTVLINITIANLTTNLLGALLYSGIAAILLKIILSVVEVPNSYSSVKLFESKI